MDSQALAIAIDRLKFYAKDAALTLSQVSKSHSSFMKLTNSVRLQTASRFTRRPRLQRLLDSDATLKINGRSYRIEKLLGEGGFSFVYLISDTSSGRRYALKKILVTSGQEGVKAAMREVEAYRRFKHPNIIKILDSAVVQDEDGQGKIIYL